VISKTEACRLVVAFIATHSDLAEDDAYIVLDDDTIERSWGWVFFYTSQRWRDTGDIAYAIVGNAPLLVERSSGRLIVTGTVFPIARYLQAYEETGDPHG